MANGAGRIFNIMKQTSEDTNTRPGVVLSLTVTSTNPLKLMIDDKLEIGEEFCVFNKTVNRQTIEVGDILTALTFNEAQVYFIQQNENKPIDISSVVDSALSSTSRNPVQNRIITSTLNNIDKKTSIVSIGIPSSAATELVWIQKGKNLLNTNLYRAGYINSSGNFTLNLRNALFDIIPVLPNTQYTYSTNGSTVQSLDVAFFDKSKNYLSVNNQHNVSSSTFTTPSNCFYCYAWVNYDDTDITQSVINSLQLQFEQRPTRSSYSDYIQNEIDVKNSRGVYENIYQEDKARNWRFQVTDVNATKFDITIPKRGGSNIKSALVFTNEWVGIISVGSSSQTWSIPLGSRNNTQCTSITQLENTATFARVQLTFNNTQYGGIEVICPYQL